MINFLGSFFLRVLHNYLSLTATILQMLSQPKGTSNKMLTQDALFLEVSLIIICVFFIIKINYFLFTCGIISQKSRVQMVLQRTQNTFFKY